MLDFTVWDKLLHQYVNEQGRVDYAAWKREQLQVLADWLLSLKDADLKSDASSSEQLALWINLYNAFTISTILERYPIKSILPKVLGVPNWIAFLWFFQRRVYDAFGKLYSLTEIEHQILRKDLQEPKSSNTPL